MNGYVRCSRYAFGPNRLHYCGPDKNQELFSYIQEEVVDPGLEKILSQFKTMYPYLRFIAQENGIKNPLDEKVVEAYWIGNDLLEHIDRQKFYRHLVEGFGLKKKLGYKKFSHIEEKLRQGAVPHHSFHVFDIWRQSEQFEEGHALDSLDHCRISWGKVITVDGPFIIVETELLEYREGEMVLGPIVQKALTRSLESEYDIEQLTPGELVSIHWNVICEKITPTQAKALKKYTLQHVALANQTL